MTRPSEHPLRYFLVVVFMCFITVFGSAQKAQSQPYIPEFIDDCRKLVKTGSTTGQQERECYLILLGVVQTLSIIGSDYYPVGKNAGFCLVPGTTPLQLADVLVTYADIDPDCVNLSSISGCLSLALRSAYGKACDM